MFCPVCHEDYPPTWKACPKDATLLLRSPQIGKYTVDGLLGVGGMGAVYKAVNPDTKGHVAIKVMDPAMAGAGSARTRFQREAAAVAALNTTHVVKVYDFGAEPDGTLYLVMEFLRGHALRDEIAPLPDTMHLARVQMVFDGALRGLAAAHKAGIVHRDLKPENIYVAQTDDGEVAKLLDFGIARVRTKDSDLTRTGAMMGTASYMAPEQIAGNHGTIGPWSDVYSMGVILYELLSGHAAFGGTTITDVLSRVLKSEIDPLPKLRTDLPEGVYEMVARCMSVDATKRPQDADELRVLFNANRLVPLGTLIPHARTTVSVQHTSTGMAATEGNAGVAVSGASGVRSNTPAIDRVGSGPVTKRSKLPLLLGGVAVLGLGGVLIARSLSGTPAVTHKDVGVIAVPRDAAVALTPPPADAAVVVDDPAMVQIAAGTYEIGELTAHGTRKRHETVTLPAFRIDKHEVTRGEALHVQLAGFDVGRTKGDALTTSARYVDWSFATGYCKAIGKRLPSEAEWEVAAQTTPSVTDAHFDHATARLRRKDRTKTTEDDLIGPTSDCSAAGLCDMLGGLLEWTADEVPKQPGKRIARGASYATFQDGQLDSIHGRFLLDSTTSDNTVGFRCVK